MAKIEIVNRALLKLGEPPVSSLSDTAFGRSYDIIYDDMKKILLSSYPWRFAVKKTDIARDAEQYDKRYVYRLPPDFLLLLKVNRRQFESDVAVYNREIDDYEIAGQTILSSVSDGVSIEYVSLIDDKEIFPPLFREALAAKIAAELAMRLKQSVSLKQFFDTEFYNFIRQAELNNEIEKHVEILPDCSWVTIRETW